MDLLMGLQSVFNSVRNILQRGKENDSSIKNFIGDIFGGTAAMLVALPSAIAFGLIIFAPLGAAFSGKAVIGGIMGTIAIGIVAPIFGGTKRLVSAPCAPAAAVLSVFASELINRGSIPFDVIPVYIALVAFLAGIFQIIAGNLGGGKFIKYIPYPVVAGYLSGVGVLIICGQLPKLIGIPKDISLWHAILQPGVWRWESLIIGCITIVAMFIAPKLIKGIPATIIALITGIICFFGISFINPQLLDGSHNPFIIGAVSVSIPDLYNAFTHQWSSLAFIDPAVVGFSLVPALTLTILLSIDSLKTCVVLDALTQTRHNSNRELIGQGLGNIASAALCGIPGSGTMGATIVNLNSGAKTKFSGVFVGIAALFVMLLLGSLIAWIPLAALAGILIVVGYRMVDIKSLSLLKHHSTRFDFFVILAVIVSAVSFSLLSAAGVGIAFAIVLFLREQIRSSVIRKKFLGNQTFSKKVRLLDELEILAKHADESIVLQLQGQLFFGTTDQLLSELDPYLVQCKYIILDMRRVQSVDYTAVNMLKQVLARMTKHNGYLIFASVPLSLPSGQNVRKYFKNLGLIETENLKFFDDIDSALEWMEDEIIKEATTGIVHADKVFDLSEIELFRDFSNEALKTVSSCMKEQIYEAGDTIFGVDVSNQESDEIYFIKKGVVKIILPLSGGLTYHLASFTKGSFFGDMSFLDKAKRSANAIATEQVILYILSREEFDKVTKEYPEIAGEFFEQLALVIAKRLRQNNIELKTLQEN